MFNWIRSLLGIKNDVKELVKPKTKFEVEFYPRTGRYYAKANGKFMKQFYLTGIISLWDELYMGTDCYKKEDAERLIELYKEQTFKTGVETSVYE